VGRRARGCSRGGSDGCCEGAAGGRRSAGGTERRSRSDRDMSQRAESGPDLCGGIQLGEVRAREDDLRVRLSREGAVVDLLDLELNTMSNRSEEGRAYLDQGRLADRTFVANPK
jgi:hypothetical protein